MLDWTPCVTAAVGTNEDVGDVVGREVNSAPGPAEGWIDETSACTFATGGYGAEPVNTERRG